MCHCYVPFQKRFVFQPCIFCLGSTDIWVNDMQLYLGFLQKCFSRLFLKFSYFCKALLHLPLLPWISSEMPVILRLIRIKFNTDVLFIFYRSLTWVSGIWREEEVISLLYYHSLTGGMDLSKSLVLLKIQTLRSALQCCRNMGLLLHVGLIRLWSLSCSRLISRERGSRERWWPVCFFSCTL